MECPICFETFTDLTMILRTQCNHKFCTLCLLEFYSKSSEQNDNRSFFHCPVCREKNTIFTLFKKGNIAKEVITNGNVKNQTLTLTLLKEKRLLDLSTMTIDNLIYSQGYHLGLASYHFHSAEGTKDKNNDKSDYEASYILYSNALTAQWKLDNGNPFPLRKYFTNCSYDNIEREFNATIDWSGTTADNAAKWIYRMKFSADFMRITSGEVKSYDADGKLLRTDEFVKDLNYRLDINAMLRKIICDIKVRKHICSICSKKLLEQNSEEKSNDTKDEVKVVKTECGHVFCLSCLPQWLRNEVYRMKHYGPIGYNVCRCPACDQSINIFSLAIIDYDESIQCPQNVVDFVGTQLIQRPQQTIDNLIFSQGYPGPDAEGVASYHFHLSKDKNDNDNNQRMHEHSYISYKNAPKTWKLDNGEPYPTMKKFINCSYNETDNEFHGTIDWKDTPVNNGVTKWVYRMNFSSPDSGERNTISDSTLMHIHSGECSMYHNNGNLIVQHKFGKSLRYHLDIYAILKLKYSLE